MRKAKKTGCMEVRERPGLASSPLERAGEAAATLARLTPPLQEAPNASAARWAEREQSTDGGSARSHRYTCSR